MVFLGEVSLDHMCFVCGVYAACGFGEQRVEFDEGISPLSYDAKVSMSFVDRGIGPKNNMIFISVVGLCGAWNPKKQVLTHASPAPSTLLANLKFHPCLHSRQPLPRATPCFSGP